MVDTVEEMENNIPFIIHNDSYYFLKIDFLPFLIKK